MSTSPWIAALIALFVWWFSTGAILMVVRYADNSGRQRQAVLYALPMLLVGALGVWLSLFVNESFAAYIGFFAAVLLWGWIELAFLTGVITGPNRTQCPQSVAFWERFIRAWGTIAHHETALVGTLIILWFVSQEATHAIAFWTFAVLFFARISAKLNLFLGVPRINVEFLPSTLSHLPSHFRYRPMNWLFPISVTVLTAAAVCWLTLLVETDWPGFALLAALTGLALIEHWFMVVPLPDAKLWRWMIPAPKSQNQETLAPGD